MKTNADALGKLAWPLPAAGDLVLVAFDVQGNMLGERLKANHLSMTLVKRAAEFRAKHLPPVGDARVRLGMLRIARGQADGPQNLAYRVGAALWAVLPPDALDGRAARAVGQGLYHCQSHGRPRSECRGGDRGTESTLWRHSLVRDPRLRWQDSRHQHQRVDNIGMPSSVEGIHHICGEDAHQDRASISTADEIDRLAKSSVEFRINQIASCSLTFATAGMGRPASLALPICPVF